MPVPFRNRADAGQQLASHLSQYRDRSDVIVLGLPRGGVPVAAEVATALNAPLDAFLVRKLGVPGHEELAMGAIASGGVRVLNEDTVRELGTSRLRPSTRSKPTSGASLRAASGCTADRQAPPDVTGKTVILVDDGLATGSTHAGGRARPCAQAQPGLARRRRAGRVAAMSAMRCATWSTRWSAPRRRSRFTPSVSGTTTSGRRPMRRCATCLPAPEPDGRRRGRTRLPTLRPADPGTVDALGRDRSCRTPAPRRSGRLSIRCCERIGDARIVLIGEASHGTHEFYRERAQHHPAADRGDGASPPWRSRPTGPTPTGSTASSAAQSDDPDARSALGGFQRFPRWMWRNEDVLDFVRLAARAQRRAAAPARPRPASTGSISTACTPRSRR